MSLAMQGIRLQQGGFHLSADALFKHAAIGIAGPSGCGKTTLLELIAGLRKPSAGCIRWQGQVLDDVEAGIALPAYQRRLGYVPQEADLFPHLGVRENLLFGARRAGKGTQDLNAVAKMLGLEGQLERDPATLSGGERRRVSLGRALLAGSKLLLLDEPFTGLDRGARLSLRTALKTLGQRTGLPLVLVSHEPSDLQALCDRVLTMKAGVLG